MVCLRNICINTLHKGNNVDDDDDDNNNNNILTLFDLCSAHSVTMQAQSLSTEQRRQGNYLPLLLQ